MPIKQGGREAKNRRMSGRRSRLRMTTVPLPVDTMSLKDIFCDIEADPGRGHGDLSLNDNAVPPIPSEPGSALAKGVHPFGFEPSIPCQRRFSRLPHLSSPDNVRETAASNFYSSTARYSRGNSASTFKPWADRPAADLRLVRGNEIATLAPSDGSSNGPSLCSAWGSRACHQRAVYRGR